MGSIFFTSGFQYTMWLPNFLAGEWLLSATLLTGFLLGKPHLSLTPQGIFFKKESYAFLFSIYLFGCAWS